MPIESLINESIDNPPVDEAVETPSLDTNPFTQARESAFVTLADTSTNLEDPAVFGMDLVNASNTKATQQRLEQEAIALRREQAAEVEAQIMASDLTPEATFGTIMDIRDAVYEGVAPEDLAVEELAAKNIVDAEEVNQQDIAYTQAVEDQKKFNTQSMLAELRSSIETEFKSTIPGVEDAYEWLASAILFPKSGGTNVAGLMEDVFGVDVGLLESLTPGDRIIELQSVWSKLNGEERSAAIKRAHASIQKRAGLIFDNEEDAMIMMNALEAVAGSRVQAEAARVDGTWGQWIDILLSIGGAVPVKAAKNALKGRKAPVSLSKELPDEAVPTPRVVAERRVESFTRAPVPLAVAKVLNPDLDIAKRAVPHTGMPAFSPAQVMNQVSPKTAAPILSGALSDKTAVIARGLGTTRAQIADETVAPLITGGPIRKGATLVTPDISTTINDAGSDVINLMHDSKLFTPKEVEKVQENIGAVLDDLTTEEVTLVNKSTPIVDNDTGRISMDYVIGAGDGQSFPTAQAANDFIQRLPLSRLDNFQVLHYNATKGEYLPFTGDFTARGEYLLQARYTHAAASGASKERLLKTEANIFTNHVDTSVSYIERFSKGVSRLDIRQSQVQGVFKEILKPLQALKSKADLDNVWSVLKEAEKREIDFNPAELSRRLEGNQQRVSAYRSVRRFYQAVYEVRNLQYRDYLSKRGFVTHAQADGTNAWVKPKSNTDDVVSVWWDEAGAIVDKKVLEDAGHKLDILENFKPRRTVDEDGNILETPYIAVPEGKAGLQPLPSQVLHNKKTYLGRHLQTNYVVEEVQDALVNGAKKKVATVVAVANNPVDAAKAATKPGYRMRRAIENTETDADYLSQELQYMHDLQMLTNTRNRLDFNALDITRQESVLSPTESLDRVRNTMARTAVLNEWVEYNANKWVETYGDLMTKSGFSWGGEIKLKAELATNPEALRKLKEARKVRERILITSGVHDTQIGERIQQALLGAGEYLSRASANVAKKQDASLLRDMKILGLNTAARGSTALAHLDAVAKAKYLAHFTFIVANPIRQLIMQSSAAVIYGGVQHGSKYFATGAAGRDFAFLLAAKSYKDIDPSSFDEIVKKYAKVSGLSEKDARKFYTDFDESGTLGSVTSHQFLEHGFRSGGSYRNHAGLYASDEVPGLGGRVRNIAKNSFRQTERSLSHFGFEAGEKAHRMAAYLAVRNKHLVNGTLDTVDATDLGVEGIRLAGNMGSFSKSAFQQGALGLPFQFMQHTTRMVQYMLPNTKWTSWIASDVLSNREKAQVGLWSAAMYGTAGFGISTLFADAAQEAGIEIDPAVQGALEEGLAGLAFEAMVEGITGTEANINVSGTVGPLSGITGDVQVFFGKDERAATPVGQVYKVLANFATGMPVGVDQFTGAVSGVGSKASGIVGNIHKIWMNPVLSTGEKLELQAKDLASFIPMANNVFQARLMAATGEYVSNYGTPVAKVTLAEALSKGLVGIGPQQVDDVYKLNAEIRGKRANLLAPTHKELSSSGKDLANFTYNAFRRLSNGQMTDQEVMDRIEAVRAGTFLAYEDQTDRDILQASMRKELIRLMGSKETLADELVTLMASDFELSHEMGWDKVKSNIEKIGSSGHKEFVLKEIDRIKEGSNLQFEPES